MKLKPPLLILAVLACALIFSVGCTQTAGTSASPSATVTTPGAGSPVTTQAATLASWDKVRLETTMGNITIALDPDMPITAGNFENLTKSGFYNGVTFHRVIAGFMIQAGDPTGTGRGGPGYTIPDEFTAHNHNIRGSVAMANKGVPDSGSSQFFINLVDNTRLDTGYPVFGTVTDGMAVVDAIGNVTTDENNRPLTNVTILHAEMV
ncbi:MAG: peptidylprolyl isomerase [Methanoregula sp.]|jgi:peptidylprolyl isomerase|uniref:peptidylprolyl isomerase n=1 Tax=Methanoregula sp. TaxID=2052170 RepID=UPI003C760F04